MTQLHDQLKRRLAGRLRGRLVGPDDEDYEAARRVWNGMIDRRPLLIVQAAHVDDIAPVVETAAGANLPLAIRGGGHNVAGNGTVDDGLVLDLGGLRNVEVDAERGTVRIEPGATIGDVDRATEAAGLVVPIGVVSGTGVVGLTLGGGFGWLTRAYGLSIDSLLEAQLVSADGRSLSASAHDNSELFWGLRGGGGNFGVITSLTFRAQRLGPQVYTGNLIYHRSKWPAALRAYGQWTADMPDELTSILTFTVPPAHWQAGSDAIMSVGFSWTGDDTAGADAQVERLRAKVAPDVAVVEPARWVEWQSQVDDLFPSGSRAYWKNIAFDQFSAPTIDAFLEHVAELADGSAVDVHHMGGAFARVADDATAFPDRSARYWLNIYGYWSDPAHDDARIAWARSFHAAIEPHARPGEYVNFLGNEGTSDPGQAALRAYGAAKFERLVALKRRYDPANLFRLNHNIPPD